AHAVGMAVVVTVIQDEPPLLRPDRRTARADALPVPQAGPRAEDLDMVVPGAHVAAEPEPDGRRATVEGHVPPGDALGEQRVVLVVLVDDNRTQALPGDEVIADRVHRGDVGGYGAGDRMRAPAAVRRVGHVEPTLQFRHPGVLVAACLVYACRYQDRF